MCGVLGRDLSVHGAVCDGTLLPGPGGQAHTIQPGLQELPLLHCQVHGHRLVSQVQGHWSDSQVHGHRSVSQVQGHRSVSQVHGHRSVSQVQGHRSVSQVHGQWT